MTREGFSVLASAGTILLDGATGTNLRAAGMPVGVSPELWVLEHPESLLALQRGYREAGSRIVCAATFSANRRGLERFGLEGRVAELNRRLVALSREAVGAGGLVAGDMSTLGEPLEPVGTLSYARAYDVYREQTAALAEAGADLIAAETLMSMEEAVALLDAADGCGLPVACTFSVEADGSLPFGGSVLEAAETLQEMGAAALGVNCSVGPDQLESVIRGLKEVCRVPVAAKPNAGLPLMDEYGQAHYSMGPEDFARHMAALMAAGARIVGGCCGTTPEYIRRLAAVIPSGGGYDVP